MNISTLKKLAHFNVNRYSTMFLIVCIRTELRIHFAKNKETFFVVIWQIWNLVQKEWKVKVDEMNNQWLGTAKFLKAMVCLLYSRDFTACLQYTESLLSEALLLNFSFWHFKSVFHDKHHTRSGWPSEPW
mgnify:CR=1 FL=1